MVDQSMVHGFSVDSPWTFDHDRNIWTMDHGLSNYGLSTIKLWTPQVRAQSDKHRFAEHFIRSYFRIADFSLNPGLQPYRYFFVNELSDNSWLFYSFYLFQLVKNFFHSAIIKSSSHFSPIDQCSIHVFRDLQSAERLSAVSFPRRVADDKNLRALPDFHFDPEITSTARTNTCCPFV